MSVDLLTQFAQERPAPPGGFKTFEFVHPVLGGLESWGTLLQAAEGDPVDELARWLALQVFTRNAEQTWWRVRRQTVAIPDPALTDARAVIGPNEHVTLTVFLPFGNLGRTAIRNVAPGRQPAVVFEPDVPPTAEAVPEALPWAA